MSQNYYGYNYSAIPQQTLTPNAVAINIFTPQAYGNNTGCANNAVNPNTYSWYGTNPNNSLPLYPANYNNFINPYQTNTQYNYPTQAQQTYPQTQYNQQNPQPYQQQYPEYMTNGGMTPAVDGFNNRNLMNDDSSVVRTEQNTATETKKEAEKKKKTIVPLSDDYIKSLENYLNDANPKIRLIGAKEVLERFKEDENRKDNPSLTALLNKILRDTSSSVRFLGLTTLQVGYALGNNETVAILKDIQATNKDQFGQDSLLASEILLRMSAPQAVEVQKGGN